MKIPVRQAGRWGFFLVEMAVLAQLQWISVIQ